MDERLTEGELRRRRRELHTLAGKAETEPRGKERIRYGLDGPQGRQLYESCSDGELLALLRERAEALGRSPAQNEVHWTCRTYLRARFKNWPGALRAADVSLLYTGTGGKDNRNFPPGSPGTGQAAGENNSPKALTKGRRDGYNLIKNCPRV